MTAGIVLAGGRSSRYGADKLAAAMPDGRPLLAWTVAAVAEVCDTVVVVVAPTAPTSSGLPSDVVTLRDTSPFEGPVSGLAVALDQLAGPDRPTRPTGRAGPARDDIAVVVAGDMPTLVPAVLQALVDALVDALAPAVVGVPPDCARLEAGLQRDGSTMAVFPFAVRRDPARGVAGAALAGGERRMRTVLGRLTTVVLPAAGWRLLDPAGSTLLDVDRPSDLPGG
jgi:molybdopterin-guanine dinucleotide biosynthesis protein A